MADATMLLTASPKQLGKQLRAVRRRKGLSLSEVARGAGLSRRELVAYERGKVEIPESDLWVIAGSCGVDVAELVPPTDPHALPGAPESIEDAISQLRRTQPGDGLQRHLDTLYALRALPPGSVVQLQDAERSAMVDALGGDPASIESSLVERMRVSKAEAKRLRSLVLPDAPLSTLLALDAPAPATLASTAFTAAALTPAPDPAPAPTAAFAPPVVDAAAMFSPDAAFTPGLAPDLAPVREPDLAAGPVDVFEELAKLPEPIALPDRDAAGHEMFAPALQPVTVPPDVAGPGGGPVDGAGGGFATWSSMRSALPEPSGSIVVDPSGEPALPVDPGARELDGLGATHAPPIDVFGHVDVAAPPLGGWDAGVGGGATYAPVEPVQPVEHGTLPEPGSDRRDAGGWDAWWTPPEPTTDAAPPVETAPGEPVMPAAAVPGTPDGPPALIIEFVDDFIVDESTPDLAVAGTSAPEPFTSAPSTGDVWAGEPMTTEPFIRDAFTREPFTSDAFGVAPFATTSSDEVPLTDAERFAATTFAASPLGAVQGDPTAEMTDAERAASGTWTWEPPVLDDVGSARAVGGADVWPRSAAAAAPTSTSAPASETVDLPGAVELETPWGRHPESDATASGFYVDWGADTAVTDTADDPWVAAALDTGVDEQPATAWTAPEPAPARPAERPDDLAPAERPDDLGVPSWAGLTWVDPAADDATPPAAAPELAPISWRPLADGVLAAVTVELAGHADDLGIAAAQPDPEPVEEFVVAGGQWELGNAVPLVEVRGQGGLVMRRADERWALADVRSARSFALEVEVDFRAGPGFGVLFRATTDDDGRMSGYSFDVDPIHEGGSYLIRQWQGDRELWNPIAHVPAPDPSEMHGALTLRVVVIGDAVTACVNGVTLLRVDSLERACATRNREPVTGDRVGIQAWSSSDLVIDTLRVAER